jgi:hypothetical protein
MRETEQCRSYRYDDARKYIVLHFGRSNGRIALTDRGAFNFTPKDRLTRRPLKTSPKVLLMWVREAAACEDPQVRELASRWLVEAVAASLTS